MSEQISKKVTLRYPVSINGKNYPANISLDLPVDVANEASRLSDVRLAEELKRMESRPDQVTYLGNAG